MGEAAIYGLTDPTTGELRYVGKAENVKERYAAHLADGGGSPKARWIQSLKDMGLKPGVYVLERCGDEPWQEVERRWIAHMETVGARLTNVRAGGEGSVSARERRLEERVAYLEAQVARIVFTICEQQANSALEFACDVCGTETQDLEPGICVNHERHNRSLSMAAGYPLKLEKVHALSRAAGSSSPEWRDGKPPEPKTSEFWASLPREAWDSFEWFQPVTRS